MTIRCRAKIAASTALALAALAGSARAQHWMDAPRFVTHNSDGYFQSIGDVDGDGDQDVVSHVGWFAYPTSYRVYRNDGAGDLTPDPTVALPAAYQFTATKPGLADVTGDGLPDLIFRAQTGIQFGLAVFPNVGGGAFGSIVFVPTTGIIADIDVADIDGDPALEIAIANHQTLQNSSDFDVRWLDWNGAGFTASSAVVIPQYLPTLEGVTSVEAFDWSGDGVADIVTGSTYNTIVRRIQTVGGQPQLGAPVTIPLDSPNAVLLNKGDIDGDGITDLLAIGVEYLTSPSTVYGRLMVLRFAAGGSFATGPQTSIQGFPDDFATVPVTLDDWDGDGDLDLLTNTWTTGSNDEWKSRIGFFRRNANDTFTLAATARTDCPGGIAGAADLDGDGKHDAVAPRAVVFGTGGFVTTPRTTPFSGFQFANVHMAVSDHESDGDFDLLDCDGRFLQNDATGAIGTTQADIQSLLPAIANPYFWGDSAALGDFDGDGREDFVKPRFEFFVMSGFFRDMHLLHGEPNGKFVDAGLAAPAGVRIDDLATDGMCLTGDLDQDGDLDIVGIGGYWPNQGAGTFAPFQPLFAGTPRAVADVEPDGDLDVLAWSWVGGVTYDLHLVRHDPGFTFTSTTLLQDDLSIMSGALLDVDEDGDLDAAVGGRNNGVVHLLRNDGAGFTDVPIAGAPGAGDVFGLTDVDGDGISDLLTASFSDLGSIYGVPVVQVLRRTAPHALTFDPPRAFLEGSARAFVDVDQDGDLDVMGGTVVKNLRFDGATDGTARQYGKGTVGTGGATPAIGARGPLRPGTTSAQIRVRRARGGASAIFFVSLAQAALPVGYGTTLLVSAPIPIITTFPLTGAPGVAGVGELDFDVSPFVPAASGFSFFHQVFVVDPAHPLGAAASNGLEVHYGM